MQSVSFSQFYKPTYSYVAGTRRRVIGRLVRSLPSPFVLGIGCFAISMILYLFLAGAIVARQASLTQAEDALVNEGARLQSVQQAVISHDEFSSVDHFLNQGYVKADAFEVIKRTRNVAEHGQGYFN